jgi:hypothetical protein
VSSVLQHGVEGIIIFDELPNQTKLMNKLKEFIHTISSYSESDIQLLESLIQVLWETSRYHATQVTDTMLLALRNFTANNALSLDKQFIVYDLWRVVILHPHGLEQLTQQSNGLNLLLWLLQTIQQHLTHLANSVEELLTIQNTLLTMFRFFANLMKSYSFIQLLENSNHRMLLVETIRSIFHIVWNSSANFTTTGTATLFYSKLNKNVRMAFVSSIYNLLSISSFPIFSTLIDDNNNKVVFCTWLLVSIGTENEQDVILFRLVQILQTILTKGNDMKTILSETVTMIGAGTGTGTGGLQNFIVQVIQRQKTTGLASPLTLVALEEINKFFN